VLFEVQISIPDLAAAEAPLQPGLLSMCAGDFLEVPLQCGTDVTPADVSCWIWRIRAGPNLNPSVQQRRGVLGPAPSNPDVKCHGLQVYGGQNSVGQFDAVLTCFFLDTAHNVLVSTACCS
jgi:hypothetical protein